MTPCTLYLDYPVSTYLPASGTIPKDKEVRVYVIYNGRSAVDVTPDKVSLAGIGKQRHSSIFITTIPNGCKKQMPKT